MYIHGLIMINLNYDIFVILKKNEINPILTNFLAIITVKVFFKNKIITHKIN